MDPKPNGSGRKQIADRSHGRGILPLGTGALLVGWCCLTGLGCVERTVEITSDPPGAVVVVNDEELPERTPTKFSFTWYGDYEVVLRKPGYQTVRTNQWVEAPWWQLPPFDFITETLWLGTLRDEHQWGTFAMQPESAPKPDVVVERALEMRDRTVSPIAVP